MRSDRLRLQDILDAIEEIAQYLPRDRGAFDRDPLLQSHIFRHVMIVGEATWNLSQPIKDHNPGYPMEADRRHASHHGARLLQSGLGHRLHDGPR